MWTCTMASEIESASASTRYSFTSMHEESVAWNNLLAIA